jgi:hypothetical protein
MIFTTLLLIFENSELDFIINQQQEMCNQLKTLNQKTFPNDLTGKEIINEMFQHSFFEESISQHKPIHDKHKYHFDFDSCKTKFQKVGNIKFELSNNRKNLIIFYIG